MIDDEMIDDEIIPESFSFNKEFDGAGTRHPDSPKLKNLLFGELIQRFTEFLNAEGFTNGKEYEMQVQTDLLVRFWIHLWDKDKKRKHQLVVILHATMMRIEFGVAYKPEKKTIYKVTHDNLRYKISSYEQLELTNKSQGLFEEFFQDFKNKYFELREHDKIKTGIVTK